MNDVVRQERTGWRDQEISQRHREWGFNCPAVDLDFLVAEYNIGKPVALAEYKHFQAKKPDLKHPTYRALANLADNYKECPLPFFVAFYWPGIWAFKITPVTESAKRRFGEDEWLTEFDYVRRLYRLRRLRLAEELEGKLLRELPHD